MSSSRLPGKVLLDIHGRPMLAHVIERSRRATTLDHVLVAITSDRSDDELADFCQANQYPHFRGSLYDVLDRYYQAARASQADVIVRITADCPLIDPYVIDKVVSRFLGSGQANRQASASQDKADKFELPYDFAANRLPPPWGRTYPIGLDVEVCTFAGLELAWREASLTYQREHVMPFFYDQPQRFRILHINQEEAVTAMNIGALRWTVDTPDDLHLVRQIFAEFSGRDDFSWLDVLRLVESKPELMSINAHTQAKDYREFDERSRSR